MPLKETRDFIMVVTLEDEVATLPMHQIERVEDHLHWTAVVMKPPCDRTIRIQERAGHFLQRCENLQMALRNKDPKAINDHLAPPIH